MFDRGAEFPLPQGMPCMDLGGRPIRGGMPFATMGTILSSNSADAGAVVVKTAPGKQLFVVELNDLITADLECEELTARFEQGLMVEPIAAASPAPARDRHARQSRRKPAARKSAAKPADLSLSDLQAAGVSTAWQNVKQWAIRVALAWTLLSWIYLLLR